MSESERENVIMKKWPEKRDDATLYVLKKGEGVISQGIQVASGSWKGKERDFSLKSLKK